MFKFIYVKNEHEVEQRELVVMRSPSQTYFGIDLSTLDETYTEEEKEGLGIRVQDFLDQQKSEFEDFIYNIGLSGTYRTFKPEKMVVEKK